MDCRELLSFPNEVLSRIFDFVTSVKDLQNLRLTCRRFLQVIRDSNTFWKLKVIDIIRGMSPKCYPLGEIPLDLLNKLTDPDKCPIPVEWVEEILRDEIFHKELNENLTLKFYARKLMFHLKTHSLEKKLFDWISSSESQQSFLEGAILISQYGQMEEDIPNLREKVEKNLEHITNRVNELADKSDANQQKEKKILATVHQVIFSEMGFVKQNLRNDSLFDNFYIDKVLERKKGNMLIIAIIYKEVAKRAGIIVELVSSQVNGRIRVQLRWSELENEYICLTLTGGDQDPNTNPADQVYSVVPSQHVFKWMCSKLNQCCEKQIRERDDAMDRKFGDGTAMRFLYVPRARNLIKFRRLACAVSPDANTVLRYAKAVRSCHPLCGIQVEDAIQFIESNEAFVQANPQNKFFLDYSLTNQIQARDYLKNDVKGTRRTRSTQYAVGLVVIYNGLDTAETIVGVISSRMNSMFQYVLLEGGDSDYVSERDLKLHPSGITVNHPLIGMHFERFDGRRYIPNAEMKAVFPDDDAFALSLVG